MPENGQLLPLLNVFVAYGLTGIDLESDRNKVLTPQAARRWELYTELQAGDGVAFELFPGDIQLLRLGWENNIHIRSFVRQTASGGKRIEGPMLVLRGLADVNMNPETTMLAVNATISAFPDSQLHYSTWEGTTRVPVMYAT